MPGMVVLSSECKRTNLHLQSQKYNAESPLTNHHPHTRTHATHFLRGAYHNSFLRKHTHTHKRQYHKSRSNWNPVLTSPSVHDSLSEIGHVAERKVLRKFVRAPVVLIANLVKRRQRHTTVVFRLHITKHGQRILVVIRRCYTAHVKKKKKVDGREERREKHTHIPSVR